MALVICPECGREKVSDTAIACPDCGYGIKEHFDRIKEHPKYQIEDYAICPVCGYTALEQAVKECKICQCKHEDLIIISFMNKDWSQLVISDLYHDYVKNLSSKNIFDENLFQQSLKERRERFGAIAKMTEDLRNNPPPTNRVSCPYCSSYNVRKIGMTGRLVSTSLFGLGSKKVGKQWHCNNCKSDF